MNAPAFRNQIIVVTCILVGFNIILKFASKNSPPRQVLRQISTAGHFDIVFAGNSLVAAGIDPVAYQIRDKQLGNTTVPLKTAVGATSPIEHLILLHCTIDKQSNFQTWTYGFFDTQLTEDDEPTLEGNRAMAYYSTPGITAHYFARNRFEMVLYQIAGKIPYVTEHSTIWAKVELLRRRIAQFGMPCVQNNRFGRAGDFTLLEASSTDIFRRHCREAVTKQVGLSPPVRDMLRLARRSANRVIVIEMPMPQRHRHIFYENTDWIAYQQYIKKSTTAEGAIFVDASGWIDDGSCYADVLHLNPKGAGIFSSRLAEELAGKDIRYKGP